MTGERVLKLVSESNNEQLLKDFLNKLNNTFGEDYAVETLTTNIDMAKSINAYSSHFNRISNTDITFILLKSFVLSLHKNNSTDQVINEYILKEEVNELKELLKNDLLFRKYLIRKFINQANKRNIDLYKEQNDKAMIYEELDILNTFERLSKIRYYDENQNKNKRRFR